MTNADWIRAVLQGLQSAKCRWDCPTFVAAVFSTLAADEHGEAWTQKQWASWNANPVSFFFTLDAAYQRRFISAVEQYMDENAKIERASFASIGADPGSECIAYRQDVVDSYLLAKPSQLLEAVKYIRSRRGLSLVDAKHEAEERRDALWALQPLKKRRRKA